MAPDIGYHGMAEASKPAKDYLDTLLNRGRGVGAKLGYKTYGPEHAKEEKEAALRRPGGIVLLAPLKGEEAATRKVQADYKGDWRKLGDMVRASVAVDSLAEMHRAMEALRKEGAVFARRPKDRINKPQPVGYRDVLMNLQTPEGGVVEVQFHLKPVLLAKDAGHKHYEVMREVDRRMELEGRTERTPEEQTAYDEAFTKSKALYDAAWQQALGGQQSAAA